MASLLAPYRNPDALEKAQNLDAKIEDLLQKAAGRETVAIGQE
jgi:hypothetical protein